MAMCLAIPGRIVTLNETDPSSAIAEIGGIRRQVNIDLVKEEGIGPGDWILIHVGFAMSRIEESEAREQLRLLALLGEPERILDHESMPSDEASGGLP